MSGWIDARQKACHNVLEMTTSAERNREILTPDQAAAYLQVNRETIYRYIRDGKLLAARLGRAYRIPKSSLDMLLWSHSTRPDITLRDYDLDEIERFVEEDRLTGRARGIAQRAAHIMERSPREVDGANL